MKKYCILLLCLLLFPLCTGCQNNSKNTLIICTDYNSTTYVKDAVERWKHLGREGSTIETEIITIPKDETAAEIKITEIRTEIMSGRGPDLFIFETNSPLIDSNDRTSQILFPNPENAMYSDIFLPLDSYLKDFSYVNIDNCNQTILRAGQTKEGQLLFPIIYDYFACFFPEEESKQGIPFPVSWEELVTNESMKKALISQNPFGFLANLGIYADYKKEILLISEEDLMNQFSFTLSSQKQWENVRLMKVDNLNFLQRQLANKERPFSSFYAVPDINGNVTANVCVYAGISRNTVVAREASMLLDTFCELVKINEWYPNTGIFIEQDEFLRKMYHLNYGISDENITSFLEMDETITQARFYSTWDWTLWDAFLEQKKKDPEPLEQVVKELYRTMQMQLKE